MSDALVEMVTRALDTWVDPEKVRDVIDVVLEEAAKVVEDRHRFRIGTRNEPSESAKKDAAAIRALKENQ